MTLRAAFDALDRAHPGSPVVKTHFRIRTDKIDSCGKVTLRHDSKLFHTGVGRQHRRTPVRLTSLTSAFATSRSTEPSCGT